MTPPDRILDILRRMIDAGKEVEIEGLGTLRRNLNGGYSFDPQPEPQVFIAYVEEDFPMARRLFESLRAAGCSPWLDKEKLLPGQNWPRSIERAIEISDVFVACFSSRSIAKRGQFQSELRYALDCARRTPLDESFLLPVRFDACEVPRRVSDHVQYVDLFPDWERGLKRVVKAIRRSARKRTPPALCA